METTKGNEISKRFSTGFSAGIEHYFNEKTSVGFSGNYRYRTRDEDKSIRYNDFKNKMLYQESLRTENEKNDASSVDLNFDFKREFNKKGHELSFNASTAYSKENEFSDIYKSLPQTPLALFLSDNARNKELQKRNRLQLDYILPFSEQGKFEFGYKGEWENNENDFNTLTLRENQWVEKPGYNDIAQYNQNIQALYTQFGNRNGHFSYLLGLRMEYSDIEVTSAKTDNKTLKKYTSWFPTANFNYSLDEDEKNQLQLSYSRRIRRPWSRFLSPLRTLSDERNTFMGNQNLNPKFNNNYELSFITQIGKTSLTSGIFYNYSQDDINILRREVFENGRINYIAQPINIGNTQSYGVELVANTQLASWWRIFGNFYFFKSKKDAIYIDKTTKNTYDLSQNHFMWNGHIANNIKLPYNTDFQLTAFYDAPNKSTQQRIEGVFGVDASLAKDILSGKGTLSLSVRDLLNSRKMRVTTTGAYTISEAERQWRPRQITLSFSYRINQKKERNGTRRENNAEEMEIAY